MTLIDEFRTDPDSVFKVYVRCPSGNRITMTIGPMINGSLFGAGTFATPASDEDTEFTKDFMERAMGRELDVSRLVHNDEEMAEVAALMRRSMGGAQG